jgi:hypothetical protein
MKATELRIGNFVEHPNDGVTRVTAILNDLQIETETGYIDKYCRAIPLTEEWLERFGFDKDEEYDEGGLVDYRWTLMYRSLEFVSFWNSEELNGVNQPQTGVDVEYVHQLQNLYFALTGQELQTDETDQKVN